MEVFEPMAPVHEPFWTYFRTALGIRYAVLLPLAAVLSLVLVTLVASLGKNHFMTALLAVLVPLPLYVGIISAVDGLASVVQLVAYSESEMKVNELAVGGAMCLFGVQVGMILAVPGLLLAIVILLGRSLMTKENGV